MKFEHIYDEESDVLSVFNRSFKPNESIEFSENIIFDINKEGNIVALQILDASEFFGSMNKLIDSRFLSNLEGIDLVDKEFRNSWFILLNMKSSGMGIIQQPMPLLRKSEYKSPLAFSKLVKFSHR